MNDESSVAKRDEMSEKSVAPSTASPLTSLLRRHGVALGALLYVAGIACTIGAVWPAFSDNVYFSENALLPGLVAHRLSKDYNQRMMIRMMHSLNDASASTPFHEHLLSTFRGEGIESYAQQFNISSPSGMLSGTNVYAAVRAARADSTECIVICARSSRRLAKLHAMLVTFAHHSQQQIYWSKDLLFVSVEHGALGLHAFLQQYHGEEGRATRSDRLRTRGGNIVAALCLDLDDEQTMDDGFSHMDIEYAMIDGKLPNLDLFNLLVKLSSREAFLPTINGYAAPNDAFSVPAFVQMLRASARGLQAQAFGGVTYRNRGKGYVKRTKGAKGDTDWHALHSVFGAYSIDALTIRPYLKKGTKPREMTSWHDLALVVEGAMRSVNNILERLHQSFFFYYMPSTRRYVSIGVYMPGIGCLLAALVVQALALWITVAERREEDSARAMTTATCTEHRTSAEASSTTRMRHSVVDCIPYLLCAHLCPCALHMAVLHSHNPSMLIPLFVAVALSPYMMARTYNRRREGGILLNMDMLHCVCLLHAAAVIAVVSLFNYALALLIALVVGVVSFGLRATNNGLLCVFNNVLLLVAHPVSLVLLYHVVRPLVEQQVQLKSFDDVLLLTINAGWAAFDSVHTSFTEYRLLSGITFVCFLHALLPVHWLAVVVANCAPVGAEDGKEAKEDSKKDK